MKTTIPSIHEKIGSIQSGLLRYKQGGKQITHHVKLGVEDNDVINCILVDDIPLEKLMNKNVTLIQKDHDNYMYIGGRVSNGAKKNKLVVSIDIKKACWYIRKSKGSVTWLQEKCVYLPQMNIAS